jgi:hypothetical protein
MCDCCWQHKCSIIEFLCDSPYFCVFDSDEQLNEKHRRYYCVSTGTMVTQKLRNVILQILSLYSRFQRPRSLRCRSTAARLLRSWVRIPPGHGWLYVVCVVCCQVEFSATSWSLVQRRPTDCSASLCVIKKPRGRGGHSLLWAAMPEKINK